jgi:predicted nucleotidyltransferase
LTMLENLTRKELRELYAKTAEHAASFVRRDYPGVIGVLVHGSVARGEPGPFSDIDMLAVINRGKKPSEFSYFDRDIYVGIGFLRIDELEKEFTDPKAFFWARGSALATRVLYDPKGIITRILARWRKATPPHQVLEKSLWDAYHNIIEYSGKMRNGWREQDDYMTRHAARIIAYCAERAVIVLNDIPIISENYLLRQVLKAHKRPRHLGTDYPLALGIEGTRDTSKVYRAALRLCKETLRLIRDEFQGRAKHGRFRELLAEPLEKHGL